jgi:hypothetical protein
MEEHARSGMSLKSFAAAAEVPYTTLSWWRARLRRERTPRFVAVEVADSVRSVEIAVGDVVVRVGDGDVDAVARLVRAIARC